MTGVEATVEDTLLVEAAKQGQTEEGADPQKEDWEYTLEQYYDRFDVWSDDNLGWSMLLISSFMIFPTWIFFRRSKSLPKHTLPEGFYIQVFMCQFLLIFSELSEVFNYFILLVPLYYVYTYRQLFRYSIWGTVWRLSICFLLTTWIIISLIFVIAFVIVIMLT